MFAGQGPSPAQMALAKQQARLSIRQFLITIGLLRAAPFAWTYVARLWK
ncbi:RHTO0S08e04896g1_1 [Rhodotorula toruloides]|uniref:RHTO0S08e04896g1_1 n=2 Tax=Rhodotorula toruloides TaxID=5286 RepID=A0A061B9X7_RHOTO|nr:mitochondrial outer membrane translocase complex, subunit Tom5 [Rhodotorula toruloides NP11]EMS22290.1 mitochondrial outer membrane translocase complex, subunit Tom5 [Rhodotorula toruloides NP11]CDR43719.1 RHTO0S08e04896g1_1 [Rhodotorula toruloides]